MDNLDKLAHQIGEEPQMKKLKQSNGIKEIILILKMFNMKTIQITETKKELLLVEGEVAKGHIKHNGAPYKALCAYTDLTEEIAKDLVHSDNDYGVVMYQNYKTTSMQYFDEQLTALDSLNSAIEKNVLWENPEPKLSDFSYFLPSINEKIKLQKKYDEAESRTFDKNKTLIFVKL